MFSPTPPSSPSPAPCLPPVPLKLPAHYLGGWGHNTLDPDNTDTSLDAAPGYRRYYINDTCGSDDDRHPSVAYDESLYADSSTCVLASVSAPAPTRNFYLANAYHWIFENAANYGGSCLP